MRMSLLQSFVFSIFILQAFLCSANTHSFNGENLARSPQLQTEKTTILDASGLEKVSECEKYPELRSIRAIKCAQQQSVNQKASLVHDSISHHRRLERIDSMETMSFSHEGGHGGGGGGGGGGSGGVGGGRSGTGGGESNHQTHKKNNTASSSPHPWIYSLLELSVYALASLSFSIF